MMVFLFKNWLKWSRFNISDTFSVNFGSRYLLIHFSRRYKIFTIWNYSHLYNTCTLFSIDRLYSLCCVKWNGDLSRSGSLHSNMYTYTYKETWRIEVRQFSLNLQSLPTTVTLSYTQWITKSTHPQRFDLTCCLIWVYL